MAYEKLLFVGQSTKKDYPLERIQNSIKEDVETNLRVTTEGAVTELSKADLHVLKNAIAEEINGIQKPDVAARPKFTLVTINKLTYVCQLKLTSVDHKGDNYSGTIWLNYYQEAAAEERNSPKDGILNRRAGVGEGAAVEAATSNWFQPQKEEIHFLELAFFVPSLIESIRRWKWDQKDNKILFITQWTIAGSLFIFFILQKFGCHFKSCGMDSLQRYFVWGLSSLAWSSLFAQTISSTQKWVAQPEGHKDGFQITLSILIALSGLAENIILYNKMK